MYVFILIQNTIIFSTSPKFSMATIQASHNASLINTLSLDRLVSRHFLFFVFTEHFFFQNLFPLFFFFFFFFFCKKYGVTSKFTCEFSRWMICFVLRAWKNIWALQIHISVWLIQPSNHVSYKIYDPLDILLYLNKHLNKVTKHLE